MGFAGGIWALPPTVGSFDGAFNSGVRGKVRSHHSKQTAAPQVGGADLVDGVDRRKAFH